MAVFSNPNQLEKNRKRYIEDLKNAVLSHPDLIAGEERLCTKIIKKSNDRKINYLILDKSYLRNKKIQKLKIKKYYYTIKTKSEFNKFKKNNNLIFENL